MLSRVCWRMVVVGWVSSLGPVRGGENAAPSSHLVFDDDFAGDIVINEVRVPREGEARFTYYETLGWRGEAGGYAGIQAHPRGHNYLFSIWDHKSHGAPIRAVHTGAGTTTEKFGGEGTGLKSWNFALGWETDTWYTLVSRCWAVDDHTHYGCWVRSAATKEWTHLVTMDVAVKEAWFEGGTDAFLEDWLETGKELRTTHLRGGWKRKRDGTWHPFRKARYSVNAWDLVAGKRSFNYRTNWNGGVSRDEGGAYYFMTAGGAGTRPAVENPSMHEIPRTEERPGYEPLRIKGARRSWTEEGVLEVRWENDPQTAPQFRARIDVYPAPDQAGKPLASHEVTAPQLRSATLRLPADTDRANVVVVVRAVDLFDREAEVVAVPAG